MHCNKVSFHLLTHESTYLKLAPIDINIDCSKQTIVCRWIGVNSAITALPLNNSCLFISCKCNSVHIWARGDYHYHPEGRNISLANHSLF